jgi:hypothetical protein
MVFQSVQVLVEERIPSSTTIGNCMKIFSFRTQIGLPFGYFKNLGTLHGKLFEHKAWELEHTYYGGSLLDIDITLSGKEDHAGFEFVFGIFGYGINFRIYDTRHWNFILERWESYEYDETHC